ncbi:glucokinase [Melghirimyces profundicolus]|uniref:Glucokinase n=1 Tax=Melghirimyces profundicolus TaxID=1242148 RepID=A0A2T6C7X0_9BACL|nr:ROK family protein [Melghirimyces profundicolus]PTX64414.1 glucokinase [Melghirimyces profundicolus]
MYSIGLDFGGTYIKTGLLKNGQVKAFRKVRSHSGEGLLPVLETVKETVADLLIEQSLPFENCAGVGIAFPGLVDVDRKTVLSTNKKYDDAVNFSFQKWSEEAFGLPVAVDNDAKAALLGEITHGSAKNESDAIMVIFGTGIGTAAYINSRLLRGKHHQAGCLGGHISTDRDGHPCTCGSIGCMEAESSNWALPIIAREREGFEESLLAGESVIDYKSVIECAGRGDSFSRRLLDDLIGHWSAGIVNLIHAYDPETVILSGGLMKSKDLLLPRIEAEVHRRAWTPWGKVKFIVAENPEISVLLGLDALVRDLP